MSSNGFFRSFLSSSSCCTGSSLLLPWPSPPTSIYSRSYVTFEHPSVVRIGRLGPGLSLCIPLKLWSYELHPFKSYPVVFSLLSLTIHRTSDTPYLLLEVQNDNTFGDLFIYLRKSFRFLSR